MKVTTKEELHMFSQVLQKYLSPTELDQLARATEFVKRTSKYRGQDLVTLCVWLSHNLASTSLTQLCSELEATTGIRVKMKKNLIDHLSEIKDPRTGNHQLHNLLDILVIAITATICGADTWSEIEEFADAREE